jgi:Ca-activated chloride channel family protein
MKFGDPMLLWLLWLVPCVGAFLWWAWRVKQRLIAQFVQSRLLAVLTVGVSKSRQKIRLALLAASVGLLVIVAARPQWGFDWEEVKQKGLDIVVAIDTSRSMLASDVSPNRLERAKLAALDLKRLARTDRVGLVAFAGTAFLQCPLSLDDEAFRQSLNALDVNIIPQGGTAVAEAIQAALGAFKEGNDNHKVLVLFTDGEDHDGNALEAAKAAAKDGLRIFTVGVGTGQGELLRIQDGKGHSDFIKDSSGNVVKSRLDEQLLRDIAKEASGFYLLLSGAGTMDTLYKDGLAPLPKSEFSAKKVQRYHEQFYWFLSSAIVLLIVEMFFPERKRVRRTEAMMNASSNAKLRKAVALLLVTLWPGLVIASPSDALEEYRAGNFAAAQAEYESLSAKKPNDPRLHLNAGTAAFQRGDYNAATNHFNAVFTNPDLRLQQSAYYNLGSTEFRIGEKMDELEESELIKMHWEQAVKNYERAFFLSTNDVDARFNVQLVRQRLMELTDRIRQRKEALEAKQRAEVERRKNRYGSALGIMMAHRTNAVPASVTNYIERLREIYEIAPPAQP